MDVLQGSSEAKVMIRSPLARLLFLLRDLHIGRSCSGNNGSLAVAATSDSSVMHALVGDAGDKRMDEKSPIMRCRRQSRRRSCSANHIHPRIKSCLPGSANSM